MVMERASSPDQCCARLNIPRGHLIEIALDDFLGFVIRGRAPGLSHARI
jgi:hypothetical protein